ncbi:MAG: GNAT family N-acetyltransferase [Deltaproteobacteria bacterium]|nr:GNAT family N-acetyltransferase [Deltaproteobacteria bacterium]MBW2596687.1 GNAT family N-acetyltransferase [Deltaproteobacteria bacterium]
MNIREATTQDFEDIWPIFHEIVSAGETYAYDPQTTREDAFNIWMTQPHKTFVIEEADIVLGTYYLKRNQPGLGGHVCNCGYMVSAEARGRGLATSMCEHSQKMAIELGYRAMQFNLVVATNRGAIRLWEKLGFEIAGRLPKAFMHSSEGLVDAVIMYKWLAVL